MPSTGYLDVHAYTSNAQIPLEDVAITVTAADGTALAMRLTDRDGMIRAVPLPAPDVDAGQSPDTGTRAYTTVNLYARLEGYEQWESEGIQIFPDTVTRLDLAMIPLAELPAAWDKAVRYFTPSQNL